jgi:hypothetical protein
MSLEVLSYISRHSANKGLVYYDALARQFPYDLPYLELSDLLSEKYIFAIPNNGRIGYAATRLGIKFLESNLRVNKPKTKPTFFSKIMKFLRSL